MSLPSNVRVRVAGLMMEGIVRRENVQAVWRETSVRSKKDAHRSSVAIADMGIALELMLKAYVHLSGAEPPRHHQWVRLWQDMDEAAREVVRRAVERHGRKEGRLFGMRLPLDDGTVEFALKAMTALLDPVNRKYHEGPKGGDGSLVAYAPGLIESLFGICADLERGALARIEHDGFPRSLELYGLDRQAAWFIWKQFRRNGGNVTQA